MSFIDDRLLECVTYGTVGGPTWKTRRIALRSGVERRNATYSLPHYRFTVIYRNLQADDHQAVIAAFNACRAGVHSFRLKDWSDFEADEAVLPVTGTGAPQSVQLSKPYTFGSETLHRPIRKPINAGVILYANGIAIAKSIDSVGVATFTAANGAVLTWSGEFDVPVMFVDDELQFSGDNKNRQGLFLTADVTLMEDISV